MEETYSNAIRAWESLEAFRADRERCKRYVYGDQWDDRIDVGGRTMTERDFILSQGQVPLKNNILRRILRNVVGIYRSQFNESGIFRDTCGSGSQEASVSEPSELQWMKDNNIRQLAPRLLEEFLISGLVAVRVEAGKILPVTAGNFFFHSDGYDPRGWDVDLIGEVHRVSYGSVMQHFCSSESDFERLQSIYRAGAGRGESCDLTEVWVRDAQLIGLFHDRKTSSLRINRIDAEQTSGIADCGRRRVPDACFVRKGWRQIWYAPDGSVLGMGKQCAGHPYVFKAYPFIDGEVHSYISDIIDQQRYVNRLITLYDFIMKSSAKGVLLFPDESLPRGMNLEDVADEWSRFNGVIPYRAQPGIPMPTQVSGNAANIGITELLKIELQMLEDISGVSPTLQGKLETTATSGTLFARQNEAAMTSLFDVLRTFDDFMISISGRFTTLS